MTRELGMSYCKTQVSPKTFGFLLRPTEHNNYTTHQGIEEASSQHCQDFPFLLEHGLIMLWSPNPLRMVSDVTSPSHSFAYTPERWIKQPSVKVIQIDDILPLNAGRAGRKSSESWIEFQGHVMKKFSMWDTQHRVGSKREIKDVQRPARLR